MGSDLLTVRPEVDLALRTGRPVVALESTLIAHGLPWPQNLDTALAAESAVRAEGAVPATVAVWQGRPTVGLDTNHLEALARDRGVMKASRRDLAAAVAGGRTAATTVAATMALAHLAGIAVFATGGIGGAHRVAIEEGPAPTSLAALFDVSADLTELARTPILVVCAGAKSILDLPRTLEALETLGVPVVGYGTDEFPGFYLRSSGLKAPARADTPAHAAALFSAHRKLGGGGVVLAQPLPDDQAIPGGEFATALGQAEAAARAEGVTGPALTPFLLGRLAEITGGRTLAANQALIVANARLAAQVARELATPAG
jgi:pseudouridine-5'-phosphate glycosidase